MFNNPALTPELFLSMAQGASQGDNIVQGMGNMFGNAANIMTVQRQERELKEGENKTRAFVQKAFPSEDVSNLPGPLLKVYAEAALKQKFSTPDQPSIVQEYNFAKQQGFDGNFMDYQRQKATAGQSTQNEYGLNPIWVRDPKTGQQRLMVTSKDGTTKLLDTQGLDPVSPLKSIDTGTGTMLVDPRTADPSTIIPKDVSGKVEQETLGKEVGAIKAALPSARTTAKLVSEQINMIKNDPSLPDALGSIDSRLPTMFPGTARVESRIDMLTGQSFLQAREMLRGGGQITDYEGKRAEAAMARLNRAQSPEDFKAALDEFNDAVQQGLKKLEAVATGNLDYGAQPTNPAGINKTTTGNTWRVLE